MKTAIFHMLMLAALICPEAITGTSYQRSLRVEGDLYPAATITATPDAAVDVMATGAASVKPAATCDAWQLNWPANSPYCWYKRDSDGNPQGPNSNVFNNTNVSVNQAGQLILQVTRTSTTPTISYTSGEVFLDRSLGFGDYIFVVQTPASAIHSKLVASPFIYADDNREFDIEYARWSVASDPNNSQYAVQPAPSQAIGLKRFRLTVSNVTHRLRWSGGTDVKQLSFETFSSSGKLLQSWVATAGNNFLPGDERVHFNHWITGAMTSDALTVLPLTSQFVINCFKFCPKGQEKVCSSVKLGVRPKC